MKTKKFVNKIIYSYISNENKKSFIQRKKLNNKNFNKLFNHLIKNNNLDVIKFILNDFNSSINEKIINIYLFGCYTNKEYLSNEKINQIQSDSLKYKFKNIPYNENKSDVFDLFSFSFIIILYF